MMGAMEPPAEPDEAPRRSSFENYEVPVPITSPPRGGRRPAIVATAAIVLFVSAALNVLLVLAFRPSGSAAALYAVLGTLQLIGAVLVFILHPLGRYAGFALGGIGVLLGLARATDDAMSGLMAAALNAFVIWAVIAAGPSFRRG